MREIASSINKTSSKVMFANQLRGLAVLAVVVSHYIGVYWAGRTTVAQYILAPLAEGPPPRIFPYIFFGSFNPGPFGVALFFLISGFVIPFSLEKLGIARFAVARLLRIFPTYWLATAFMLAMVFASGRYWGNPMLFHDREIISNLFLVNQQQGIVTIDLVNWTLAIEMMFYGCAIILWPVVRRSSTLSLVGFAIFILALLNWIPPGSAMWDTTKYQLMMVSFLFIGT
jgi:peptidoglycan/LPS O-acetylase OafA/YrhL